jgi:von Willebrand factor type D domain
LTHQHGRDLQVEAFKVFHFVCGDTVYKCGGSVVAPETSCKAPKTVKSIGTPTKKQCIALVAEAQKEKDISALYTNATLCPNKKKVVSYAKYRSGGVHGKFCNNRAPCICCKGADGFGDPHFVTYDGTPFSYHGQCDLVLAESQKFGNGIGFNVHGRTEIVDGWSLIRNAAVQIGSDTVELTNKGVIYFNGVEVKDNDDLADASLAGLYNVTKEVKMINNIPKTDVTIALNEGSKEKIKFSLFKRLIAVHVGATEDDVRGMLGHRTIDGLVGRNDTLLYDPLEMGTHWQVTNNEPMIFTDAVSPQYPETCILPSVQGRKLRPSAQHKRRAEEACDGITDEAMLQFCIEDVMLTGDLDVAAMYGGAHR